MFIHHQIDTDSMAYKYVEWNGNGYEYISIIHERYGNMRV